MWNKLFELFRGSRHREAEASGHADSEHPSRDDWSASDWARIRAPARLRDTELSERAQHWMQRLPPSVRPHHLAARYPRIVNQLAVCWRDLGLIDHLLENLVIDRRGDRGGFPDELVEEIDRLFAFHELRYRTQDDAQPDEGSAPPRAV